MAYMPSLYSVTVTCMIKNKIYLNIKYIYMYIILSMSIKYNFYFKTPIK